MSGPFEGFNVITIDPGDTVLCDYCNKEFTDSKAIGGLLFGSKAACPECAGRIEDGAKRYGEEQYIRARCPEGMAFADWVREDLR